MGIRDRFRAFGASTEDLERTRLNGRFNELDVGQLPVLDLPLRSPVRVAGEVSGMRVVPRAGSPSLETTVHDGTGSVVAVFTGRTRIAGIDPGRGIVLEGVARKERNRVVMTNPSYTLLS